MNEMDSSYNNPPGLAGPIMREEFNPCQTSSKEKAQDGLGCFS